MISVCIATYNGEKYIYKQLKSILDQLDINDEVIVSDDGSSDGTLDIVRSFSDNRIEIVYNKNILSTRMKVKSHYLTSRNFSNALLYAKGDYIFLSDQDDIWVNDKVAIMLPLLQNYELVQSDCFIIDENDTVISDSFYNGIGFRTNFFLNIVKPSYHGCCIAFNRSVLNYALPFPRSLIMHDNWLGILTSLIGKVKYIDAKLVAYRKHNNCVSGNSIHSSNSFYFKIFYRIVLFFQIASRFICVKYFRL